MIEFHNLVVIMLQHKKLLKNTRMLLVSAIAVSLAACSGADESSTSSTSLPSNSPVSSSSPQTTALPAGVTIPGVSNLGEINFKTANRNLPSGFFNGGNNGSNGPKVEARKETPFSVSGWAVSPSEGKPADSIIITQGDANSFVAVAPVNVDRPDVVKVLKNPAYQKSGWTITINPSTLPNNQVTLKGWAYNSASKQATELSNSLDVVVLN